MSQEEIDGKVKGLVEQLRGIAELPKPILDPIGKYTHPYVPPVLMTIVGTFAIIGAFKFADFLLGIAYVLTFLLFGSFVARSAMDAHKEVEEREAEKKREAAEARRREAEAHQANGSTGTGSTGNNPYGSQ
jgi:hypothetical protein